MIHVFGGGTVYHVRNHLALCTPAYGQTARALCNLLDAQVTDKRQVRLHLTKMAGGTELETNDDVAQRLDQVLADPETRAIVFNVALCDYEGQIGDIASGKQAERLHSRDGTQCMTLTPADKLLARVKQQRPDVYLVGFKTTANATPREQHGLALRQIQETAADCVLANDTVTRNNLLVLSYGLWDAPRERLLAKLAENLIHLEEGA